MSHVVSEGGLKGHSSMSSMFVKSPRTPSQAQHGTAPPSEKKQYTRLPHARMTERVNLSIQNMHSKMQTQCMETSCAIHAHGFTQDAYTCHVSKSHHIFPRLFTKMEIRGYTAVQTDMQAQENGNEKNYIHTHAHDARTLQMTRYFVAVHKHLV